MKVYKVEEVAEILGISKRTVYRYIEDKELLASKIGRNWIIQEEDLKAMLDKNKTGKTISDRQEERH